jgi:hypothetical protein
MAGRGVVLASRILNEIAALELIVTKVERAWKAAGANSDDLYYDSVALNIHSFYSGLEKIFEKVASAVDGSVPQGVNWHHELLNQMALEIPRKYRIFGRRYYQKKHGIGLTPSGDFAT